jgi:uncharacterized membrane protein
MNDNINEVILRSKPNREPMDFERLKFLCYFIAGIIGEVFGFILVLIIILAMAGMVAEVFGLVIALLFILCAFGVLK